ncbi:hypothetical protein YB2330_001404 [Saitoella coloradoensis]
MDHQPGTYTPPHLSADSAGVQLPVPFSPTSSAPPFPLAVSSSLIEVPTPAPSPQPHANELARSWKTLCPDADSDGAFDEIREKFSTMPAKDRGELLIDLLSMCTTQELVSVNAFVAPRLKRDFLKELPTELGLRILSYIDDAPTLARASQVSRHWHGLLNDDLTWKLLCQKHRYRRLSSISATEDETAATKLPPSSSLLPTSSGPKHGSGLSSSSSTRPPKPTSYKSHFKQRYIVEQAWRSGGKILAKHITQDNGVVTALHLTSSYIVVGLDNSKIHVFDQNGKFLRTLIGHDAGVWALVPYGDTLVSGGCDRDLRVWDLRTGMCRHTLQGHSSTVRCLKMSDSKTAISGSRDTTLRIWDIERGECRRVLIGHGASVRCVEVWGDLCVSGSYDTTARIWSISTGQCLKTLQGHVSQIYAIAFDGEHIATGSLDTTIRIWDPQSGMCLSVLQGHTSLVGQLQIRYPTLVTGGSDGSVRVWDLETHRCVHRLAAHDNSVTSLQFDSMRIVSAGSDGRVKVWDLQTGVLMRELGSPADAVWRVAFEEEKAVVLASRNQRTTMELISFEAYLNDPSMDYTEYQVKALNDQKWD